MNFTKDGYQKLWTLFIFHAILLLWSVLYAIVLCPRVYYCFIAPFSINALMANTAMIDSDGNRVDIVNDEKNILRRLKERDDAIYNKVFNGTRIPPETRPPNPEHAVDFIHGTCFFRTLDDNIQRHKDLRPPRPHQQIYYSYISPYRHQIAHGCDIEEPDVNCGYHACQHLEKRGFIYDRKNLTHASVGKTMPYPYSGLVAIGICHAVIFSILHQNKGGMFDELKDRSFFRFIKWFHLVLCLLDFILFAFCLIYCCRNNIYYFQPLYLWLLCAFVLLVEFVFAYVSFYYLYNKL